MAKRQTLVRNLVKAVVKCDFTQDPPIEPGYEQPYDVVMSSFCIGSVIKSNDEYQHMLAKHQMALCHNRGFVNQTGANETLCSRVQQFKIGCVAAVLFQVLVRLKFIGIFFPRENGIRHYFCNQFDIATMKKDFRYVQSCTRMHTA